MDPTRPDPTRGRTRRVSNSVVYPADSIMFRLSKFQHEQKRHKSYYTNSAQDLAKMNKLKQTIMYLSPVSGCSFEYISTVKFSHIKSNFL